MKDDAISKSSWESEDIYINFIFALIENQAVSIYHVHSHKLNKKLHSGYIIWS